MRPCARLIALLAALLGLSGLLVGCGDDGGSSSSKQVSLSVDVMGTKVSPKNQVVEVPKGSEVRLEVKADKAGELHIHSRPEQTKEYNAGTTRISLGRFVTPGRYPVEIRALDSTVATLDVK